MQYSGNVARNSSALNSTGAYSTPRELDEIIYRAVSRIPRGKVSTYGVIAGYAGLTRGARRVGRALRELPSKSKVPWYRVVNSKGRIALARGSAGEKWQRRLLVSEGVIFQRNRIDLKLFGWRQTLDEFLWGPD